MQNPNLVTTEAFDGLIREVALELGVSDKRIYEILGRDNPYVKTWRLLNVLGRLDASRLELIRADFNARCQRLTGGRTEPSTVASIHKETSEAVQSVIERRPRDIRRRELNEAIAELQKELAKLDAVDTAGANVVSRFSANGGY